jgi:hypothetical protein
MVHRTTERLRCYHYLPAEWGECFANRLFVRERPIDFRSIEERYSSYQLMPMHPSPIADSSRPFFPSVRICIPVSSLLLRSIIQRLP